MNVSEAIYGRRSIRKYLDKAIPQQDMEKILDAARWAPSACNRQLWEFVVVTNTETKKRIAYEACYDQDFLLNAATLVVVFYDDTKERREEVSRRKHDAIQSAAAAIQNMHLTAYSLGIGSLWVCGIRKPYMLNKILGVPDHIRLIAIVAFGYPAEQPEPPTRRPKGSFIHYEKFSTLKGSYSNSLDPGKWSIEELSTFRSRICWYGGTIEPDKTLEKFNMPNRTYKKIIDIFKNYNHGANKKILDIMPFAGGYLVGILQNVPHAKQVYVYELNEGNVHFIKQNLRTYKLEDPNFIIGNDSELHIPVEEMDLVTCLFRLEKIPNPKLLMQEMLRVLKKGGHLVLATELKGFSEVGKWIKRKKFKNLHTSPLWNTGPTKRLSNRQLHKLIIKYNFKIIEQNVIRENSFLKSMAKQVLRANGVTLLTVLEKK